MIKWFKNIKTSINNWFDEEHTICISDSFIEINNYTLLLISLIVLLIMQIIF